MFSRVGSTAQMFRDLWYILNSHVVIEHPLLQAAFNFHLEEFSGRTDSETESKNDIPVPTIAYLLALDKELEVYVNARKNKPDISHHFDLGADYECMISKKTPRIPVRLLGLVYDYEELCQLPGFDSPNGFKEIVTGKICFKKMIQPAYDIAHILDFEPVKKLTRSMSL